MYMLPTKLIIPFFHCLSGEVNGEMVQVLLAIHDPGMEVNGLFNYSFTFMEEPICEFSQIYMYTTYHAVCTVTCMWAGGSLAYTVQPRLFGPHLSGTSIFWTSWTPESTLLHMHAHKACPMTVYGCGYILSGFYRLCLGQN